MSVKKQNLLWMLAGLTHMSLSHAETQPIYEIEIIAFEQPTITAALNEQWPELTPSRPAPRLQRLFSTQVAKTSANSEGTLSQPEIKHDQNNDPRAIKREESGGSKSQDHPVTKEIREHNPTPDNFDSNTPTLEQKKTRPDDFTLLAANQLQLKVLINSLLKKRLARRILLHTGWAQRIHPAKKAIPVFLEGGNPLRPNQADRTWLSGGYRGYFSAPITLQANEFNLPDFELVGTISFYETRYPRIETNLCQTIGQHLLTSPLTQTTNSDQFQSQGFQQICNREIRGLSYDELIYFDSPTFGLIVQIREQPPVEQAELNSAHLHSPGET